MLADSFAPYVPLPLARRLMRFLSGIGRLLGYKASCPNMVMANDPGFLMVEAVDQVV